jgi:DNA polymerase-3 subunit epsilon
MFNADIFFFDVETTGLDVDTDAIVQIAYKRITAGVEGPSVVSEGCLVVNPMQSISAGASAVHGFTNESVADKPPFDVYADTLYSLAHKAIWCGYNVTRFDTPIFMNAFAKCNHAVPKPSGVIDSLAIFHHFYGKSKVRGARTLTAAHLRYCGCEFDNAHDALADIQATYDVLEAQIDAHADCLDINFAVEISKNSARQIDRRGFFKFDRGTCKAVCAMGKYTGTPVEEVPDDYFKWILSEPKFEADIKKVASNALIGVYPVWRFK